MDKIINLDIGCKSEKILPLLPGTYPCIWGKRSGWVIRGEVGNGFTVYYQEGYSFAGWIHFGEDGVIEVSSEKKKNYFLLINQAGIYPLLSCQAVH